jgi:hypothetical protein
MDETFFCATSTRKSTAADTNVEYISNSITDKYRSDNLNADATVDQKNTTVNANTYAFVLSVIGLLEVYTIQKLRVIVNIFRHGRTRTNTEDIFLHLFEYFAGLHNGALEKTGTI